MGYDMHAVYAEDTNEHLIFHEDENGNHPGYFRLNIWGMQTFRGQMEEAGMLDPEAEHVPFMPKWDTKGNSIAQAVARLASAIVTDSESSKLGVIPRYKLCSNDGWLVTPNEIRGALRAAEGFVPEWDEEDQERAADLTELWSRWLHFLRLAAEEGGFRVY